MYWIIFGIVDLFVLAVFGTLLHLRKKKSWESLFNDYELKEDLPKEVQEKYWEDATALDAKLFFRIFLLIQLGAIGSYFTAWMGLFIVCAAIYIFIWYGYAFLKIKVQIKSKRNLSIELEDRILFIFVIDLVFKRFQQYRRWGLLFLGKSCAVIGKEQVSINGKNRGNL